MKSHERIDGPRLLVSVRSVEEAQAALAGGCDILDIKEPSRGSLGMADVTVIESICRAVSAGGSKSIPVSVALGETTDWLRNAESPSLPDRLSYCKLGTAKLSARPNWRQRWVEVRRRFQLKNSDWIAVAYADWQPAESPVPAEIVSAAIETKCAGVLFDTFVKDGRSLLDWVSPDELPELIDQIHASGLFVALAGSLRSEQFPELMELRPDIIAVRTAACAAGDRNGTICTETVSALKSVLHQSCHSTPTVSATHPRLRPR